jgi:hypothetical protein
MASGYPSELRYNYRYRGHGDDDGYSRPPPTAANAPLLQNQQNSLPGRADNRVGYSHHGGTKSWRPWWLERSVVGGFCVLFALVAGAVLLLAFTSQRRDGLMDVDKKFEHIWRFGPTAGMCCAACLHPSLFGT